MFPSHLLLDEVRSTISATMSADGGRLTPSIYDTALHYRLSPFLDQHTRDDVRDWLLHQQHADGGWGDPIFPWSRDASTLAVLLACPRDTLSCAWHHTAWEAGLTFLRAHARHWERPFTDELPVGIELLLPQLLRDAAAQYICLASEPYTKLISLGEQRRTVLRNRRLRPGIPPLHSWESYGETASVDLLDGSGGVGNSPSATAAWLARSVAAHGRSSVQDTAVAYLQHAATATGTDLPGILPVAWPITRFEQSFVVYALLLGDLFDDARVAAYAAPVLDELDHAMRAEGMGFSDHFMADGDDTSVACAVLWATGRRAADSALVLRWLHNDGEHFCTYPGELQSSISVTAHAMHALHLAGQTAVPGTAYLLARQRVDGLWAGDKWHVSSMYATSQVLAALASTISPAVLHLTLRGILQAQRADGSWGDMVSLTEETAYAVLALRMIRARIPTASGITGALGRAKAWLFRHAVAAPTARPQRWVDKELYIPLRVARMVELTAMLALIIDEEKEATDDTNARNVSYGTSYEYRRA